MNKLISTLSLSNQLEDKLIWLLFMWLIRKKSNNIFSRFSFSSYIILQQSWPKYMRQTLVLVWDSALREKFKFNFSTVFCWYWQNFHFGRKTRHEAIILWRFEIMLSFPNFLSLKSLYIPCLLLIILVRFACGERKIW